MSSDPTRKTISEILSDFENKTSASVFITLLTADWASYITYELLSLGYSVSLFSTKDNFYPGFLRGPNFSITKFSVEKLSFVSSQDLIFEIRNILEKKNITFASIILHDLTNNQYLTLVQQNSISNKEKIENE